MYGQDGFGGNNQNVDTYPHYESVTTSTDGNTSNFGNTTTFGTLPEALRDDAPK